VKQPSYFQRWHREQRSSGQLAALKLTGEHLAQLWIVENRSYGVLGLVLGHATLHEGANHLRTRISGVDP
jgi:hypothetical protein